MRIKGVTEDSRNVQSNFIFVARKGEKEDGAHYIKDAIRRGAVAIVVDRAIATKSYEDIPLITVTDCALFLSHASALLAGNPSEKLSIVAVTGTNGKTTVTHFIGQLLRMYNKNVAVIGTTGIYVNGRRIKYDTPQMTTLPAEYLHPLLKYLLEKKITHVVLEASSLGLSTNRLAHCQIDVGVVLNVSEDHYDEHGGKEPYIKAKRRLFHMATHLIVNRDDEVCMQMAKFSPTPIVTFGRTPQSDIFLQCEENQGVLVTDEKIGSFQLATIGEFNWMNATAALGTLYVLGYDLKEVLPHTAHLTLPEGRMSTLTQNGITAVIDYAHTPDALKTVLASLNRDFGGRVIAVFGCGGERDIGKREKMGEVAALYADYIVATSDNPRGENPLAIIQHIVKGVQRYKTPFKVIPDRRIAIRQAIIRARKGDVILIAGKGHEKTQHTSEGIIPFDDFKVVESVFKDLNEGRSS